MTQVVDVVEAGVPLLGLMLTGYCFARFRPKVFPPKSVFLLNSFVFLIGIPCLIFKALATKDLEQLSWRFILGFMLLRTVFGILSAIPLLWMKTQDKLGDFLINLISSTWINTVIFGIPMLQSVYGGKVIILNVLAAISSVIYQMPVMLMFFEYREVTKAALARKAATTNPSKAPISLTGAIELASKLRTVTAHGGGDSGAPTSSSRADEQSGASAPLPAHNAGPTAQYPAPTAANGVTGTENGATAVPVPDDADSADEQKRKRQQQVDGGETDDGAFAAADLAPTDSYRVAIQNSEERSESPPLRASASAGDSARASGDNTEPSHTITARVSEGAVSTKQGTGWSDASAGPAGEQEERGVGHVLWVVVKRVTPKLLRNHPFVGICIGLLWSLILRMAADENEFPKVIDTYVQYFADCVTPVASFCTGMFMHGHERDVLRMWKPLLIFVLAKMIVMPALAMPMCLIVGLDGIEGRSAVLLASLPVALASFTLITTYMKERPAAMSLMSSLIIVGSILMPFAFAAWNEILIAGEVFGDVPRNAVYTG